MDIHNFNKAVEVLEDMIASLPATKKQRKNMLQIAGYPSWENVISNILAFYLDENEDHNFGRLFFDSLLEVLRDKGIEVADIFTETSYEVAREKNHVDIVIQSVEGTWAIIIENKLQATLYNDLKAYWNGVEANEKIGVVLNLYGQDAILLSKYREDGVLFYDLLYSELLDQVNKNLHKFFEQSDDRHLLMLKDFFSNIKQNYTDTNMTPELQEKLHLYQKNYGILNQVRKLEKELHDSVSNCLFAAMRELNFPPGTINLRVKGKHFYADETLTNMSDGYQGYRFYVDIEPLLTRNLLIVYFELFDEHARYGDKIKEQLSRDVSSFGDLVKDSTGCISGQYHQIGCIYKYDLDKEQGTNMQEKVKNVIERNFFGESGLVHECAKLLTKELDNEARLKKL